MTKGSVVHIHPDIRMLKPIMDKVLQRGQRMKLQFKRSVWVLEIIK